MAAAVASASQHATSNPAIAMRTMPCTPMSAKRSDSRAESSAGAARLPRVVSSIACRMLAIAGMVSRKYDQR